MMEESAKILAVKEGQAYISAFRQSSCGDCSARSGCGTSVLSRYIGTRSMQMWVNDPIGVEVDDEVIIQLPETGLFRASFLFYLFPLILFIAFAIFGEYITRLLELDTEILVVTFATAGLFTAFAWLHLAEKKIIHDNHLRPVIIKRSKTLATIPISIQRDL